MKNWKTLLLLGICSLGMIGGVLVLFGVQMRGNHSTQPQALQATATSSAIPWQSSSIQFSPHMTETPTSTPTQTPVPISTITDPNRYYAESTPVSTMRTQAASLNHQQVKELIEQRVKSNWSFIQQELGFTTLEKAYAFFLGMATRESTFNASLETGTGPGHSYGLIQASEDAYNNPLYPEEVVPEMKLYDYTPENFYDPGIAVYMGIRHLLHFVNVARADGYTGIQILRHALIGYNTGNVKITDQTQLTNYSDEIGALAGWYLLNGHLYDAAGTWTGSSAVDRTNSWGWY